MEELIKVIVDNGLGFGSFVALLYFIFKYVDKLSNTMNKISDTMIQMQINLEKATDRIDKIEEKMKSREE